MLHTFTSPFYPLFTALDVNTKAHEDKDGRWLWAERVTPDIEVHKAIATRCETIQPFVPPVVDDKPWEGYLTQMIANERHFLSPGPGAKWHSSFGYVRDQYFVNPRKLLLTIPGIGAQTGQYTEFGIPVMILAHYLRRNGIVPERCDPNSILSLLTPAENAEELAQPVAMLAQLEQHIENDIPLADVLPIIFSKYPVRYRDYAPRELCQKIHSLHVSSDMKDLRKTMFRLESLPAVAMNPQGANSVFIRDDVKLVRTGEAAGRIATEGALPYPPGVLCVVPGEVWGGAIQQYFLALEEGVSLLLDFLPELQSVYSETDTDGIKRLHGYAVK